MKNYNFRVGCASCSTSEWKLIQNYKPDVSKQFKIFFRRCSPHNQSSITSTVLKITSCKSPEEFRKILSNLCPPFMLSRRANTNKQMTNLRRLILIRIFQTIYINAN